MEEDANIGASWDMSTTKSNMRLTTELQQEDKTTTKYYLKIPSIRINLAIMMLCWITASFNYFMLGDLLGSFVTIFAPEVAEIQSTTPIIIFTSLSGITGFWGFGE